MSNPNRKKQKLFFNKTNLELAETFTAMKITLE